MEMKPEYNYGLVKERYRIHLLSNDAGTNLPELQKLLAQKVAKFKEYSFDKFKKLCQQPQYQLLNIYFQNRDECDEYASNLQDLGASPEIDDVSDYRVVKPDVLVQYAREESKRFTPIWQRFHPDYEWADDYQPNEDELLSASLILSGDLVRFEEYALDKWAQANDISSAYRTSIRESRSFERHCIRLWRHDEKIYALMKRHPRMGSKDFMQMIKTIPLQKYLTQESTLLIGKWDELNNLLADRFWSYDTWRVVFPGDAMMDGTDYICEGWEDGQYKILYDHSGHSSIAYMIYERFRHAVEG